MSDLYSLYWWDREGNQHLELKHVGDWETLRSAWARLTSGPAAQLGVVRRVIITDAMDTIALEYNYSARL